MNVDLDAIAQRGHCEVSSLRLALPLIEQGYTPPFLARYRRDELGGLDEASMWALSHAVRSQQRLDEYRDQLHAAWQSTQLADPALGRAISGAKSRRLLDRLSRRVKIEAGESGSLAQRLAVRLLSPEKGDGEDLEAIAASVIEANAKTVNAIAAPAEPVVRTENAGVAAEATGTSAETSPSVPTTDAVMAKLDDALAKRLSGDPRIMGAAVRWLSRNAKIHVVEVTDPHGGEDDEEAESSTKAKKSPKKRKRGKPQPTEAAALDGSAAIEAVAAVTDPDASETTASVEGTATAEGADPAEATQSDVPEVASAIEESATPASLPADPASLPDNVDSVESALPPSDEVTASLAEPAAEDSPVAVQASEELATAAETVPPATMELPAGFGAPKSAAMPTSPIATAVSTEQKAAAKPPKKKKVSPRQRRRRWLVSTLKPLAGKRMPAAKLSAFQIVMLGRALRSQVAQCAFDYDAAQLVAEMQKAATQLNRHFGDHLAGIVAANEAALRDAAEGAWWDEIQEQASARLVSIAADNLHSQINRGGVSAKVVMSIDAVGPRTAATSIVAADGRVLHNEDLPCQLSAAMRTLAVTKIGELIHQYHVDLIVISNGPARRACMIAIGELIKQSAGQTIRWTLADRSGADAYAGSPAGDQEMKSTPRRFRAAAWIAFSTLQPSQAMVKVDPLKLRLGSFQRELSDQAVLDALEDVLVSGAARGGVDVNSTAPAWLERLPGMTRQAAEAIDKQRREKLISSRSDLLDRAEWPSPIHTRQALPFLRVFRSEETLDGTLIHPDDYPLAKRLAKALDIQLPPDSPVGYELPDYSAPQPIEAHANSAAASDEVSSDSTADTAEDTSTFGPMEIPEAVSNETGSSETESLETASLETESLETESAETVVSEDDAALLSGETAVSAEASDTIELAVEVESTSSGPVIPAAVEPFRQVKPERAKVEKLIKEWQVGVHRSLQIVSWLCEPFGEGAVSGPAPAVMDSMPGLSDLKQGDQVIGVVVGVMPFGVFVELTPECSGLIHVSRVSDGFVEDLHEAVQVGDVVTAWVTGIDSKRRRVGLSAISPERELEMQSHRHDARGGGGHGRGQSAPRGAARGSAAPLATGGHEGATAPRGRSGSATGAPPAGRGGRSAGPGERSPAAGGGGRQDHRGGGRDGNRGRSAGGGQRGDHRGGGRGPRRPEVYEVVGKEPDSAPLSEAMQKGKEPLRSFGDLMQFVTKDKAPATKTPPAKQKPADVAPPSAESKSAETESKPAADASTTPPDNSPINASATSDHGETAKVSAEKPVAAPTEETS